jgi:hypothetical protein
MGSSPIALTIFSPLKSKAWRQFFIQLGRVEVKIAVPPAAGMKKEALGASFLQRSGVATTQAKRKSSIESCAVLTPISVSVLPSS